jgi:hypothetical protein
MWNSTKESTLREVTLEVINICCCEKDNKVHFIISSNKLICLLSLVTINRNNTIASVKCDLGCIGKAHFV